MPSLRERLARLSAARTSVPSFPSQPLNSAPALPRRIAPRYPTREELFALVARPWLGRLPFADPQEASLLMREPPTRIPPLSEWLFLDLETTGLAGGTGTYAFLIGLGQLTSRGFCVRQFFLHDLAEEKALLAALGPQLDPASVLVTYNGKLFDAPILETRFRLARLPFELEGKLHLDLLYPARRLWKPRLNSLRLLELEQKLLAYERDQDIAGELIPPLYFDYLRHGDERRLQVVFRHNAEDVLTLAALAARMLQLAAGPEQSADSVELCGLAGLFERAHRFDRARALYDLALRDHLPVELESAARYRLALLCKRQRHYRQAAALWTQLAKANGNLRDTEKLAVYEELAICYEHRLEDPEIAAEITRRALTELELLLADQPENRWRLRRARQRFTHRLDRLTRNQARPASPTFF